MESPSPRVSNQTQLSFTSLNDDKPTTIILLHGGFSCRLEFALVVTGLTAFHLLLPDLPLHSASRHIAPGTVEASAEHVARLIQELAHGGKAHVVGVSMGGYVAQCLALDRPELVRSIFVTGASPPVGVRHFMAKWPSVTWYSMRLMLHWMPDWLYRYQLSSMGLKLSDELVDEMRGNITWPLVKDMFPWILTFTCDDIEQLKVRTLSIAGAKGDDVNTMKMVADALRRRKSSPSQPWPEDGSGGVVIRKATHGWDMQLPELFAKGVVAWVNEGSLPIEFERL